MAKNYLLIYSEQLATNIELLCQKIKVSSNTLFQIRKSSSSVYANIREANYGQSKADMLSKFEIALKECSETEGWLQLLFNTPWAPFAYGSNPRFVSSNPIMRDKNKMVARTI